MKKNLPMTRGDVPRCIFWAVVIWVIVVVSILSVLDVLRWIRVMV